jgi:hypothetical protein
MMSASLQRSLTALWCSAPRRLSDATSTCVPMLAIPALRRFASLKSMATLPTSKGVGRKPMRSGRIRRSEPGGGLWRLRIVGLSEAAGAL